jgi:hypothetical protein
MTVAKENQYRPGNRRLRVFSFDPSFTTRLDTTEVNEITLQVPWEFDTKIGKSRLMPGPVGEYIEVIDYDPSSGVLYAPVNLDDAALLVSDGLSPSEGRPQFHQQMVYAVAMATINHFEEALGRVTLWAPHLTKETDGRFLEGEYVPRLRIYPHALREANAYYSPAKKALLFGYFPTSRSDETSVRGMLVFTCLSYDIIAHETTHALLDGLHPRFIESTNFDVLALHEAFADIVALFQRFAIPEVLRSQVAQTRGDLASQNLLGQLAQQFGRATGRRGALRDFLGTKDEDGNWIPYRADARLLAKKKTPHERGAILVAAIFNAFLLIYKSRIADLLRIATHGTGVLPMGELHPDLVGRLSSEAAKSAQHILQMCIRALDYCPPVDVTFGDYLRAIITADIDLFSEDKHNYRVAIVEAFRLWGIYPEELRTMSIDALTWPTGAESQLDLGEPIDEQSGQQLVESAEVVVALRDSIQQSFSPLFKSAELPDLGQELASATTPVADAPETRRLNLSADWDLESDRKQVWDQMQKNAELFHNWLINGPGCQYISSFGLVLDKESAATIYRGEDGKTPEVEIHSMRSAMRRGNKGSLLRDLVVEIVQRRRGYFDRSKQKEADAGQVKFGPDDHGDFTFRRGCTILFNPDTGDVRRVIRTRGTIADNDDLDRVRRFLLREEPEGDNAYYADPYIGTRNENAIARLHGA